MYVLSMLRLCVLSLTSVICFSLPYLHSWIYIRWARHVSRLYLTDLPIALSFPSDSCSKHPSANEDNMDMDETTKTLSLFDDKNQPVLQIGWFTSFCCVLDTEICLPAVCKKQPSMNMIRSGYPRHCSNTHLGRGWTWLWQGRSLIVPPTALTDQQYKAQHGSLLCPAATSVNVRESYGK